VAYWARALAHPTRVAVLRELTTVDQASPQVLAKRLDQPLGPVAYHVRTLRGWNVLELTGTTHRRGAIEHHYRLTASAAPIIRGILSMNGVLRERRR
jgi:hypothetical protein